MVWNGPPSEWRLSVECHGRSEWNDAAAAVRLRWQIPRPVKDEGRGSGLPTEESEGRYPTVTHTRIVTSTYRYKPPAAEAEGGVGDRHHGPEVEGRTADRSRGCCRTAGQ